MALPSCTCTASVGQNRACASFSPPPTPQLVNNTLTYTSFDNGSEKIVAEVTGTLPLHGLGLSVGQYAELRRTFTATDLTTFGRLTGDYNPIHYEEEDMMHRPTYNEVDPVSEIVTEVATAEKIGGGDAAANTMPRIVHGILVASLFPSLISSVFPTAIYRHQKLKFVLPLLVGTKVLARCDVRGIRPLRNDDIIVELETNVWREKDGASVLTGEGECLVRGAKELGVLVEEGWEEDDGDNNETKT